MPFGYAKVRSEGSNASDLEPRDNHPGPGQRTLWYKTIDWITCLRWPLLFFFLAAILASELSILYRQPSSFQLGTELNNIVPIFSKQQSIFHTDPRYASDHKTMASINETKQHWSDLMPRGGGFINIPDYSAHTLPPPMHFPEQPGMQVYAVAVFHELHCLMHMSGFIDKLVMQMRARDFTLDEREIGHNDHCVNYLRNAIMCCGDTTLEGQAQEPPFDAVPGTIGTGAVHVCRNYDEITTWVEQRRIMSDKEQL